MSNRLYPAARNAFLRGNIDVVTDDIAVQLVSSSYTYSDAHEDLADLTGTLGDLVDLDNKSVSAAAFFADPVSVTGVAAAAEVDAIVVALNTGTPATSTLIAYLDTQADTTPVDITGTGGIITITWPVFGIVFAVGG